MYKPIFISIIINMKYDCVIIGAGPIGLLSAIALNQLGFKVVVLESKKEDQYLSSTSAIRLYAISEGSLQLLHKHCSLKRNTFTAQPINAITVSDHVTCSSLEFHPKDVGLKDFGLMIDEQELQSKLYKVTQELGISVLFDQKISKITSDSVMLLDGTSISSKLFIVADGKHSKIRALLGVQVTKHKYHQHAVVADIKHQLHHHGVAFENFTPQGPFAVLPKHGGHISSIVWTIDSEFVSTIKSLDINTITALMQERVGDAYGEIEIASEYVMFPLELQEAKDYVKGRFVLLGDSLHAIHPLAGQGLNLSIRDLASVLSTLQTCNALGLDIGNNTLIEEHYRNRALDNAAMAEATTILNVLFSNNDIFVRTLRSWGLELVDASPFLKSMFMNYASGLVEI